MSYTLSQVRSATNDYFATYKGGAGELGITTDYPRRMFTFNGVTPGGEEILGLLVGGDNTLLVNAAGTDVDRARALSAAYAKARLLGGLSASNRATVLLPPGIYDFTALRSSQSSPALLLDAEFVDIIGLSGNARDQQIRAFPVNNDVSGPTVRQTALDVHLANLWIPCCVTNANPSSTTSYASRGFEQVPKVIASGATGGTDGGIYHESNAVHIYPGTWATADEFVNVQINDYIEVGISGLVTDSSATTTHWITDLGATDIATGAELRIESGALAGSNSIVTGYNTSTHVVTVSPAFDSAPANGVKFSLVGGAATITRRRSFKVVALHHNAGSVYATLDDLYNGIGNHSGSIAYGVEDNATHVGWTVRRTAANSEYRNLDFSRIGDDDSVEHTDSTGTVQPSTFITGFSRYSSPWGSPHLDGTWKRCRSGLYGFRVDTYGHLFGTYEECESGDSSFVGDGTGIGLPGQDAFAYAHLSAEMIRCKAGHNSFAGCTAFGSYATANALLFECRGGNLCVCTGREFEGTVIGGKYGRASIAGYAGNETTDGATVGTLPKFSGTAIGVVTDGGDSFGQGTGNVSGPSSGILGTIKSSASIISCINGPNKIVATTGNTATLIQTLPLANAQTYFVTATISVTGTAKNATLKRSWMVTTTGNVATVTAANAADITQRAGLTTADITLVAGAPGLQLKVTGETSTNLTWKVLDLSWRV